jgi:hypothetical protein
LRSQEFPEAVLFVIVLTRNVLGEYSHAHTTSRVAEAGISFPTDLEKYMSARPFSSGFVLIPEDNSQFSCEKGYENP